MNFRDKLIDLIDTEIEKTELELNDKKNNISNNYTLAKLDFTVIDNYSDSLYVYGKIREQLVELQERIIERNSK